VISSLVLNFSLYLTALILVIVFFRKNYVAWMVVGLYALGSFFCIVCSYEQPLLCCRYICYYELQRISLAIPFCDILLVSYTIVAKWDKLFESNLSYSKYLLRLLS